MQNRRSFFNRIATIVAIVALAPEIAFRARIQFEYAPKLDLQEMISSIYKIARERAKSAPSDEIMILTDAIGAEVWQCEYPKAMVRYYNANFNKSIVGIYEQLKLAS
jgi:hypothetical protein